MTSLLANIVWLFHISIILFIVLAPFTQIPAILILHITFAICLLVHWYTNSNTCSLTILEAYLREMPPSKTFMYQFISPLYNISSTDLNTLAYIVTCITMFISIYFLYNNTKFNETMKCYSELKNKTFNNIIKCFQPLFLY